MCAVETCEKAVVARGWCSAHYTCWQRYGDPLHVRATLEDRFFAKIAAGPNNCWIWTSVLRGNGYGAIRVGSKFALAHRVSYEMHRGPIPAGLTIDHLCDETRCVNPDHLEPATGKANTLRSNGITAVNARKTHCVAGHPLSGDNVRDWRGHRHCRTCARDRARIYRAKGKGA